MLASIVREAIESRLDMEAYRAVLRRERLVRKELMERLRRNDAAAEASGFTSVMLRRVTIKGMVWLELDQPLARWPGAMKL